MKPAENDIVPPGLASSAPKKNPDCKNTFKDLSIEFPKTTSISVAITKSYFSKSRSIISNLKMQTLVSMHTILDQKCTYFLSRSVSSSFQDVLSNYSILFRL